MNMKKLNLALIGVALMLSTALVNCSKDEKTTNTGTCIGTTYKTDKDVTFMTIDYNADKRPIKINDFDDSTGVADGYTTIAYTSTTITEKGYNSSGTLGETTVNTIGSNGKVVSSTYNYNDGDYIDISTSTYEYNSEGYLIKQTENHTSPSVSTTTYDYTITGGNVSHVVTVGDGYTNTTDYTYYTDKPLKFDLWNLNFTAFGKGNSNPVKKSTGTSTYSSKKKGVAISGIRMFLNRSTTLHNTNKSASAVNYVDSDDYTYEYNADNYITKETDTYLAVDFTDVWVTKCTYACD